MWCRITWYIYSTLHCVTTQRAVIFTLRTTRTQFQIFCCHFLTLCTLYGYLDYSTLHFAQRVRVCVLYDYQNRERKGLLNGDAVFFSWWNLKTSTFIFVGCILLRYIIALAKCTCNRNWNSLLYFSLSQHVSAPSALQKCDWCCIPPEDGRRGRDGLWKTKIK
jgi:hypothetical protein